MKRSLLGLTFFLFLFLIVPLFFALLAPMLQQEDTPDAQPVFESVSFACPDKLTILQTETGTVITVDLETCVADILSRELSQDTPPEAIKAQAVAARSYLLSKVYVNAKTSSHPDAMLCDDAAHCISFSFSDKDNGENLTQALEETKGEYLAYENLPARCFYFRISSGKTESALDVWNLDLPYLPSVDSEADSRVGTSQSRVIYPLSAFKTVLKGARHSTETEASSVIKAISRTDVGHVKTIQLYNETFTGEEIKTLFHLKSTNFNLRIQNKQAVFEVKGDGHGVGMSMFGARYMAQNGSTYTEILNHYYPGTASTFLHQTD
ncbi:MAG: SpoIID/LytB domain-containing protein [Clostridia bacterium]|nr:SpoIID/LytB domain-containing protein [Clostridia bacterium]